MFDRIYEKFTNPEFYIFMISFLLSFLVVMSLFYILDKLFYRNKININYYKIVFLLFGKSAIIGSSIGLFTFILIIIFLLILNIDIFEYDGAILTAIALPSLTISSILITLRTLISHGIDVSKLEEETERKFK